MMENIIIGGKQYSGIVFVDKNGEVLAVIGGDGSVIERKDVEVILNPTKEEGEE